MYKILCYCGSLFRGIQSCQVNITVCDNLQGYLQFVRRIVSNPAGKVRFWNGEV